MEIKRTMRLYPSRQTNTGISDHELKRTIGNASLALTQLDGRFPALSETLGECWRRTLSPCRYFPRLQGLVSLAKCSLLQSVPSLLRRIRDAKCTYHASLAQVRSRKRGFVNEASTSPGLAGGSETWLRYTSWRGRDIRFASCPRPFCGFHPCNTRSPAELILSRAERLPSS